MGKIECLFVLIYGITIFLAILSIGIKYYIRKAKLNENILQLQKEIAAMTKGTVLKKIPENGEGEVLLKKLGNSIKKRAINIGNTPVLPGTEVFVLEEKNGRLIIFPKFSY